MVGSTPPLRAEPTLYQAFGLRLASRYPLPLAPVAPGAADVVIEVEQVEGPRDVGFRPLSRTWTPDAHEPVLRLDATGHRLDVRFEAGGHRMRVRHHQPEADLAPVILGVAMGALLHVRGVPALHATAVALDGRALLLAGGAGIGKSTLAAMLVGRGLPLFNDDLVALSCAGARVMVPPGVPALRLCDDVPPALGLDAAELAVAFDGKLLVDPRRLPGGFGSMPAELGTIYLLTGRRGPSESPRIRRLPPARACVALTGHLYGANWLGTKRTDTLALCGRVANQARVCEVSVPEGLRGVAIAARAIVEDAQL